MITYRLTPGGVIKNEGIDDECQIPNDLANTDWVEYLAWVAEGNTPLPMLGVQQPLLTRKITKLAFRNRFTTTEKVTLDLASIDNPAAPMATRQAEAVLRVFLKDLDNATYIDLDRADVQGGLNQLVSYGLLTADRVDHILHDPIQAHEEYHP